MEVSRASHDVFAGLLEERTGQAIAMERSWRIATALTPLLKSHGIDSLDRLAGAVSRRCDPVLADAVVDALLNNETSFFRDMAAFRTLADTVLPRLAAQREETRHLRIWSAGCSTGQEAYSLAMLLANDADRWSGWTIDLIGTDVSGAAIARARAADYSHFEVQRGLPFDQLARWFEPVEECWRIVQPLRCKVRFQIHNLLDPVPARSRTDLILCRNVLFYLSPERRRLAFDRLADSLAPDGLLMLGAGETVLGHTDRFAPDESSSLHRRTDGPAVR